MALLPLLFGCDPWELRRPVYHEPDFFGLGIAPSDIQQLASYPQWTDALRQAAQDFSLAHVGKDGFQACIDVKQFKPSEITVKTVDNCVVIEGKHEERQDEHGLISRQFVRKYMLPKGYDPQQVVSTLSSDGVLTIKAPPPAKALAGKERVIQVQQTGPARLNVKDNQPEKDEKEMREK